MALFCFCATMPKIACRIGWVSLGVSASERQRHIAWDIGAAAVVRMMSDRLGAFAILQNYSRLVIDCNRSPAVESSIVTVSEDTENSRQPAAFVCRPGAPDRGDIQSLSQSHRRELDRRQAGNIPTVIVAVHSFTPVYRGSADPGMSGFSTIEMIVSHDR